MVSARDARLLDASQRCVRVYLDRGTTDVTVSDLCRSIDLAERTFYRYFPIKAHTILPVFAAMTNSFERSVAGGADDLRVALHDAFVADVLGFATGDVIAFFRLIHADQEMWSTFLEVAQQAEAALASTLGRRLGHGPAELGSRAAAVAVVSASRLALEAAALHRADPVATFDGYVATFGAAVLPEG